MSTMQEEKTPIKLDEIKVRTLVGGKEYRVHVRGVGYSFMLGDGDEYVTIYSPASCIGGFSLAERFGGQLSPSSIREFITRDCKRAA